MVANIRMVNGGAGGTRPNGYVGKFDNIRDPVGRNSYFRAGGHRRVRQRIRKR